MRGWRQAGLLRRVEVLAVLVVLVVLAVLGIAITAANDARHSIDRRGNQLGPANTEAEAPLADFTDEGAGGRGSIVTQGPGHLSPHRRARAMPPRPIHTAPPPPPPPPDLLRQLHPAR